MVLLGFVCFVNSALSQIVITGTNQTGSVPLNPTWIAASGSLIAGLVPTVANGNFGEYTGANVNNLTQPGIPLTIHANSDIQTNMETCGNDGTAGSSLVYTLPASTYGYNLTNITVSGGWQDGGRDAQDYTVYYSTVASPNIFFLLASVSYIPSNPGNTGDATRVIINNASGAAMATNVAVLKFDFTFPDGGSRENGAAGYTAITVQGTAATSLTAPPIVGTVSNQNSSSSFTPTWKIETNSLIAGQIPSVGLSSGNFTAAAGVTGVSALTDGTFGLASNLADYATCGSLAGQSVTYALNAAMITNIVVYSGWQNNSRDGQFYNILYSTVSAPSTFIPLAGVSYNPAVTGVSANRVAITTSTGAPLATNVAFIKFDFTQQSGSLDNGYSGYAEIIVQGTNGPVAQPIFGSSPMAEPYPYVNTGSFSGPAVPLSPDPLVAYRWPNPQASDGLQVYTLKPITVTADTNGSFANLQSLTNNNPNVTVQGLGSIQMDFGQENAAWLEFDSPDLPNVNAVTMSISEYNQPEITQYGGAHNVKTLVPTKYGNTYRLELNSLLYEGVRFGWIHVNSFTSPWHITGLRLVCQNKPANYNGSFSSSDTMLNRIWYAGAYSVKLNLLATEFGAILVDRGDRASFTGDAHASQAASLVAFGNYDFVKANLDNTANQNQGGILSYSLLWVLSLIDYYNYSGDATTLNGYISTAESALDNAYAIYGTNPSLVFYGWDEHLGGFENPSCPESQNAYKMLSIRAWQAFATTMGAYGRTDLQAKYNGYANAKIAALRQNPTWYQGFGLHACADAVNTGLLNVTEESAIFAQQFTNRVNRVSFSGFNQYFIIQAFAGMDKYDDALNSINDLWGGEINYGGTTFFELSRPSWDSAIGINDPVPNCQSGFTSLCHPWSAGVVKWLSEEVLGIKPTAPGFATYQILPHLGRTLTYVTGQTPTPLGNIQASFNVSNGLCSVTAPAGTVGTIGIPMVEKTINSIAINGTLAWDGTFHPVAGIGGASNDTEYVYFTGVQAGAYSMSVSYTGVTPVYNAPPAQYPAQLIKQDTNTSGNWGGVYGKDGYVLCNYNANGTDIQSLPSYVSSLSYFMIGGVEEGIWTTVTSDTRALAPNSSNQYPRNATAINTAMDQGTLNTMTFTFNCSSTNYYQIALYFVDWDRQGRRLAVEVHDANTLDLVAPVNVITNFSGGEYLVYTYNKSAKFRIDHVRGDNAVLSGIFFDPAPTNSAPVLGMINDKYVYAGQTVQFTTSATDAQSAYQTLTFGLSNAPAGASISPASGAFLWVTTNAAAPGTNLISVSVTDNGTPPLSNTKTFSVFVSGLPQFTGATAGTNGQVKITFNTLPTQNYQVQFKVNLTDANWTTLGGIMSGTGSPFSVSDNISGSPQRFYRLLALPL
jgi:alpha-L-rhamnosidase